jgi:spore coat protein U-like protein
MRNSIRFTALAAAALAFSTFAFATGSVVATGNMTVTAYVQPACSLTVNPLVFGLYDVTGVNSTDPVHGTTTLAITCTGGAPVTISMDPGKHWASSTRAMSDGKTGTPDLLTYNLFSAGVDSTPWGDGTSGTAMAAAFPYLGLGNQTIVQVYGTIPAAQLATGFTNAGVVQAVFQDIVTVDVNY